MKNLFLLSFISILSLNTHAQIKVDVDGAVGGRYDNQSLKNAERVQDTVSITFKVSQAAVKEGEQQTFAQKYHIALVGVVQNSPKYGLRYHTLYDFKNDSWSVDNEDLYLKNIYLQGKFNKTLVSLGALESSDKIGVQTVFGKNSWVDGVRVDQNANKTNYGLTVGSVNDLTNPNILTRKKELNYFEVHITREVFEKIIMESSAGHLDGENFFRFAASSERDIFHKKLFKFTYEQLVTIDEAVNNGMKTSLALGVDLPMSNVSKNSVISRFQVGVRYSYTDEDIGQRGLVRDDLIIKGNNVNFSISSFIDKDKRLSVYTSYDTKGRFVVGANYKFNNK
jgi:hypothetical protein